MERSDVVTDGGWPRDLSGQGPAANGGGATARGGQTGQDTRTLTTKPVLPAPVKYTLGSVS